MRTALSLVLALLGIVVAAHCHAASKTALIGDSPLNVRLVLQNRKTVFLKGHVRFDLRIETRDLERLEAGAMLSKAAVLNNLSVRLDDIPRDELVVRKAPSRTVRVGLSALPLQDVALSIDARKGVIQFTTSVLVDPPSGVLSYTSDDQTGTNPHRANLTLKLWIPAWLQPPTGVKVSKHLAKMEIAITARPYKSPLFELRELKANAESAGAALVQAVDVSANAVLQTLCIQPIAVSKEPDDPDPAGYLKDANGAVVKDSWFAQQDQIKDLWEVATINSGGVVFQGRPWKSYVAPNLKVIKSGEETRLSNEFPDSEDDCVEVYFIEKIENRDQNGAATNRRGTAEAQVIFSDEILAHRIYTRLAHELGHVLRIPHPDQPRGGDQYRGSTGTVACVYADWDKPNLLRNSANNIEKSIVPAGVRGADVVLPRDDVLQPVCLTSVDCGLCDQDASQAPQPE